MNNKRKALLPMVFVFIFFNVFFLLGKSIFEKWGVDRYVLIGTNMMFFIISLINFYLQHTSIKKPNANVFVRSIMGGVMIKMFACIIALLVYYFLSGTSFNKPAIYGGLFLYLVYLVMEVSVFMKLNKEMHA